MSIETHLSDLTVAITENTAALREILAAGGVTPTNVVAITETPKPAAKKAAKAEALGNGKAVKTAEPEPAAETPTKVATPAVKETEFSDPLDPSTEVVTPGDPEPVIDVEATIAACVETFKQKMLAADPARKAELKEQFPTLRSKWGLIGDAKLASLSGTPEKLVGLLADIEAL